MLPELRAQIERCSGDRESLRRIQALLPADDGQLDRLIEETLAEGEINAFGFVVLAALAANRPVDARHLARSTSVLLQSVRLVTVAFRMRGNVAQHLLEAMDVEPFEPGDAAFILLLIAVWSRECAHTGFPRGLFPKTRELLRMTGLDKKTKEYLLAIAVYTEDAALMDLLCRHHYRITAAESERARANELVQELLAVKNKPFLHDMPEKSGLQLSYGDTMRRAVPRTGRNDPCHCGSGRKYKQCCLAKDNERLRSATDIAGVTTEELRTAPETHYTPDRMDRAHRFEVLAIDPLRLPPALFERYIPRLVSYRLYDRVAEAFEKVGFSDNLDFAWTAGVQQAAFAGRKDIARRLIDLRKLHGLTDDQLPAGVSFLLTEDDPEECLEYLEDTVRAALESDDTHSLLRLAFGLLYSRRPALGIALARGVVPLLPASDAAQLMQALLRARDQLNLAPDDALTDVLEELSIYEAEAEDASEAYRDVQEKYEAQRRETRELREELERSRKKMKRLEADRPHAAAAGAAAAVQASPDKSRQERKIVYLEEQLRASRGAENSLRRDMQQIHLENQQLKQQASLSLTASADPEGDREDELLLQTEALGAQPVRTIEFARDFQQRLGHAPRHVAVRAMTTLGEVAAGQPAAFVGALRLKACPSVMRHRIGMDWRLLFRLLADRIEAVDLIPRQDLERRVKTLVTQYA